MKPSIIKRSIIALLALVGIVAITYLIDYLIELNRLEGAVPPGTESEIGGSFTLTDSEGVTRTERDFNDKHKLIFFGFTHCPDICPTTLSRISQLLQQLEPLSGQLYPLFISVDPKRDTPERLKQYAQAFDPGIIYLTGTPQNIDQVTKAWRATYAKYLVGDKNYSMMHSSVLYLMSPEGKLLTSFTNDKPIKEIAQSLRTYLKPSG